MGILSIGVPKEMKNNENRVALTPSGVIELVKFGHKVIVQSNAGTNSGFDDVAYQNAGAEIVSSPEEVYTRAEMILKVKEPIRQEYNLIRENQLIFTYFHFASSGELTNAMIQSKSVCIAYETVEAADGSLPLLIPMSEVAGRMAIQEGAKYLEKPMKGKGLLLGGVPGTPKGNVVILGGGVVGTQAAKIASGFGAEVVILDISLKRLRHLAEIMPPNVTTIMSNQYNIEQAIKDADLVIGAVLIPGAKAPYLIRREMLKLMKPGTVLVDVAVDQGGCIETCIPTTHEDPIFVLDDIVHYCVANMPGAVPYTSTLALTNATLPFVVELANKGWEKATAENAGLRKGLNIVQGRIVHKGVAEAFGVSPVFTDK
jgi:alanine dehydrogenase